MSITINAPDIEAKLRDGAHSLNVSVEDYTVGVLRAALDALASTPEVTPPGPNIHTTVTAPSLAFNPLVDLDEDELEERRQSAEYLRRTLDETRSFPQPLAPSEKQPRL